MIQKLIWLQLSYGTLISAEPLPSAPFEYPLKLAQLRHSSHFTILHHKYTLSRSRTIADALQVACRVTEDNTFRAPCCIFNMCNSNWFVLAPAWRLANESRKLQWDGTRRCIWRLPDEFTHFRTAEAIRFLSSFTVATIFLLPLFASTHLAHQTGMQEVCSTMFECA